MRVLLVNPPFTIYGGLEGQGGKSAPLNLAYLSSYLKQHKPYYQIKIIDAENLRLDYDLLDAEIREFNPDILGITMPTPAFEQAMEVVRRAKWMNHNVKTIVGGPHPTAFPKEVSRETFIDFVVYGEGEKSFYNLCDAIEYNKLYNSIQGIAYSGIINPPQPLIDNLDEIPFPARDLLPMETYYAPPTKRETIKKNANIISSRGCPYNCTYCMAKTVWGRKTRFRSVKNVVDEIQHCVDVYGIGEFNFNDELFTCNRQRTIEFCQEVMNRDLDISFVCSLRVNHVWKDVLGWLKIAGCKKVMFGFESGSQLILDNIKKGATLKQAEEAVALVKRFGIKTSGAFMIGNIGETEETIRETIDFSKKLNVDTVSFYVASPYPGTEFYEQAKPYFRPNVTWSDFALIGTNPLLDLPNLSHEKIAYWYKRAYREYYLRIDFIRERLRNIKSWIDIKNIIDGLGILKALH